MKIRMLTSMAGDNVSLAPGDEVDKPAEVAHAWIADGLAQAVAEQRVETADLKVNPKKK